MDHATCGPDSAWTREDMLHLDDTYGHGPMHQKSRPAVSSQGDQRISAVSHACWGGAMYVDARLML